MRSSSGSIPRPSACRRACSSPYAPLRHRCAAQRLLRHSAHWQAYFVQRLRAAAVASDEQAGGAASARQLSFDEWTFAGGAVISHQSIADDIARALRSWQCDETLREPVDTVPTSVIVEVLYQLHALRRDAEARPDFECMQSALVQLLSNVRVFARLYGRLSYRERMREYWLYAPHTVAQVSAAFTLSVRAYEAEAVRASDQLAEVARLVTIYHDIGTFIHSFKDATSAALARVWLLEALKMQRAMTHGPTDAVTLSLMDHLALVSLDCGLLPDCVECAEVALEAHAHLSDERRWLRAPTLLTLARAKGRLGSTGAAINHLREALQLYDAEALGDHFDTLAIRLELASLLASHARERAPAEVRACVGTAGEGAHDAYRQAFALFAKHYGVGGHQSMLAPLLEFCQLLIAELSLEAEAYSEQLLRLIAQFSDEPVETAARWHLKRTRLHLRHARLDVAESALTRCQEVIGPNPSTLRVRRIFSGLTSTLHEAAVYQEDRLSSSASAAAKQRVAERYEYSLHMAATLREWASFGMSCYELCRFQAEMLRNPQKAVTTAEACIMSFAPEKPAGAEYAATWRGADVALGRAWSCFALAIALQARNDPMQDIKTSLQAALHSLHGLGSSVDNLRCELDACLEALNDGGSLPSNRSAAASTTLSMLSLSDMQSTDDRSFFCEPHFSHGLGPPTALTLA